MSSLLRQTKQVPTNSGYYINVASIVPTTTTATLYYNAGTEAAPVISTNVYCLSTPISTILQTAGKAVFRDEGKTLVSSSRVFRKVQLLVNSISTSGVGGVESSTGIPAYYTGYIELPGTAGASSGTASFTPVARLG